jgi:hypothetical protein
MVDENPPTIGGLARAIAGDDPQQISISGLERLASSLARTIRDDEALPGRPKMRKRLEAVAEAARRIENELSDSVFLSLVLAGDRHWTKNEGTAIRALQDIQSHCRTALGNVQKGQGRRKHNPRPEGLAPAALCALIVSVAWQKARQRWPGKDNPKAQHACEMLWRLASGRDPRHSVAVWRDHLRDVRAYQECPEVRTIRRSLTGD